MSKLTLPIVIGRRYVRRDGISVTAKEPHHGLDSGCVYVGTSDPTNGDPYRHAWLSTGRINNDGGDSPRDLVADYIEAEPIDAEVPKGHPYATLLRAIAGGVPVQWRWFNGEWEDITPSEVIMGLAENRLSPPEDFRVKPKTIRIGEFDVPEPLREAPEDGATIYVANPFMGDSIPPAYPWNQSAMNADWLEKGLLHADRDAALLHTRALLSFTKARG